MRKELEYQQINEIQKGRIENCKEVASTLLDTIDVVCPNGRAKSIALTKLEECVMWMSKSISHEEV